jgi:exopolyphosphatase / guanosine-5'-triphosphate,3'-diphosphate pyrophosphatase
MRKAVIDVGSNSVLLLVSEEADGSWVPIYEDTSVTALGEGTKKTGLLSEEAMVRTLDALATMWAKARELGAVSIVAGATMAARIASNTAEFQARAERQGTPVQVISGEDEARLGFLAVANDPLFASRQRISIIDPGGHSTELVTAERDGPAWRHEVAKSFGVGTLGLKGEVLLSERSTPTEILSATDRIDRTIADGYDWREPGVAVVLGATGTNLVSIRERLEKWEPDRVHGAILDYEEVGRAVGWMMPMTDDERRAIPGMEPGRERTVHIGSLILERFMYALRVEEVVVSIRGWRHALLESD